MGKAKRALVGHLAIDSSLFNFIEEDVALGMPLSGRQFWAALEALVREATPANRALLKKRDDYQAKIDAYHQRVGDAHDERRYRKFLEEIGYIVEEGGDFAITTGNVDPEISRIAGPQLVVPVNNSRYAVNAVNGRWGSLYDALYGSDVIPEDDGAERGAGYNRRRGGKVISYSARFLDVAIPLAAGSHRDVAAYRLVQGETGWATSVQLQNGGETTLADPAQFLGFAESAGVQSLLFANNGLHIELQIDRKDPVGRENPSGVKDVVLEAAITTICDCEDSVTAVDGEDKAATYRNWLGLVTGSLAAEFVKGGQTVRRTLNPDREYNGAAGGTITLPGRSVMLIRNVGHLMTTGAVLLEGEEIPEGILDTMVTAYIALHQMQGRVRYNNSRTGSVYIVKPKMHGPEEVAFACEIFRRVEQLVGLPQKCLKLGIMDEERRTSVNLKECIRVARERIIFINTGFLDRTGDEIHTSMEAGPMMPKESMKNSRWITAYENRNVDVGLAAGFCGRAQIGKGMWARPDRMAEMVATKISHPRSGANCAWVPSPTAATLHAMHYHQVDVFEVQKSLALQGERTTLDDLLAIPLLIDGLTPEEIQREIENNAQSILGYVVRWVDQGIGCSKVPDINDVGLMEDRATLRISSQYLANWIHHTICTKEQVLETLKKMAAVVDRQNGGDMAYTPMAPDFDGSHAFQAACELVFAGRMQPNGYTEPILHKSRLQVKALAMAGR